jgi:hypothetical protein
MKNNTIAYLLRTSGLFALYLSIYACFAQFGIQQLAARETLIVCIIITFVWAFGNLSILPFMNKGAASFVNGFLVLTTVQFLLLLASMSAIVFTNSPNTRLLCYHIVGTFVCWMIIQSILLSHTSRNQTADFSKKKEAQKDKE